MKEWMIIVIVVTIIALLVFYPRKEEAIYVTHEKVDLISFEIEVRGEVVFPGYYRFYEPMRLDEILKFTKGLTLDADMAEIDLSKTYDKDNYIYIPSLKDDEIIDIEKININTANFETLISVSGITENIAISLLVYRQANGPVSPLDDLIHVKYIGTVTLEKIRPYLTLG